MRKYLQRRHANAGKITLHHQLAELEGYVGLGMKRASLRMARQFLKRNRINARSFESALEAIFIQADRLGSWRPLVEQAHARLSKRDQRTTRSQMLAFYCSLRDWDSAHRVMPKRLSSPTDLLFAMDTVLNLRKMDAAKSIQRRCDRMLKRRVDRFQSAALLEALASYHAQAGELGAAEKCWLKSAVLDEPFARNGLAGLVEIAAVRGMRYVTAGLLQIEDFKKPADDLAITLPNNRKVMLAQAERQLNRYQSALEKIVPPSEFWRFGDGSELAPR
jgi:hypothetical protein